MTISSQDHTAARLDIMELLHRYSWGYDTRDVEMLGSTFTTDGSCTVHLKGTPGWGPYVGRDVIVEWQASFMKIQSDQRRHSMTNILFDELTPSHARVRCFLVLTAAENGLVRLVTTGVYRIETGKEDGCWRIRKLDLFLDASF